MTDPERDHRTMNRALLDAAILALALLTLLIWAFVPSRWTP